MSTTDQAPKKNKRHGKNARTLYTLGKNRLPEHAAHTITKVSLYVELADLFYQVLSKYAASEKIPKSFGIGQKLYPSEIHMIHAIGRHPDINVTDLAKYLGITKGAVPKMIKKLKLKGLVDSCNGHENRKQVHLRLTVEGRRAHKGYLQYHEKRNGLLKRYVNRLTKDDIAVITKMLKEVGRYADMILGK